MKTLIRIKIVVLFVVLLSSATILLHSDYFQDSLYRFILLIEWLIFLVGLPVRTIPWEKVKHGSYISFDVIRLDYNS